MAIEVNTLAENLTSFVDGLGELLGHNCEIVLFSCEDLKQELIYSVNNQVTGRKHGDSMNCYELEALSKAKVRGGYTIFSYTTKEGRNLKAALFTIKAEDKNQCMIMIINYDMTDFLLAKKTLELFCAIDEKKDYNDKKDSDNVNILMQKLVLEVLEGFGRPISYLSKDDKVSIVSLLNDKGIFLIKGSVEYVAEKLCVSRYTIYNYLEEIRLHSN